MPKFTTWYDLLSTLPLTPITLSTYHTHRPKAVVQTALNSFKTAPLIVASRRVPSVCKAEARVSSGFLSSLRSTGPKSLKEEDPFMDDEEKRLTGYLGTSPQTKFERFSVRFAIVTGAISFVFGFIIVFMR